MQIRVHRATTADIPAAAQTLALAFEQYPWTRWSIPDEGYADRLEALQRIYLEHALACGLVLVAGDADGVVALMPPEAPAPTDEAQTRIAALLGERLPLLLAAELPRTPSGAWELATLGVHPSSWGHGIGGALLAHALREVGQAGPVPVALETSDPRNVTLYSRHGFAVTATTRIPAGPVVYSMVRPGTDAGS